MRRQAARWPAATPQPQAGPGSGGAPAAQVPAPARGAVGPHPWVLPNFFISRFRIPPFLLPIYQAAGVQSGVRWEVLAAINEIETDYGRNLNVSSAARALDAVHARLVADLQGQTGNQDGVRDPYNPVDAIFAAARYLRAAGADRDLGRAVFAYNHADWYVDAVLTRARVIGGLPANLVGSLTGLTQGRFPVDAQARYAGAVAPRGQRVARGTNPARPVESQAGRRGIRVSSRRGAAVVATNDGRILRVGVSARLGRFVQLQDVYGNTYTYGNLAKIEPSYPSPEPQQVSRREIRRELALPKPDAAPDQPASVTARPAGRVQRAASRAPRAAATDRARPTDRAGKEGAIAKQRLFANPERPRAPAPEASSRSSSAAPPAATGPTCSACSATAPTSSSSACGRAPVSPPARSSGASARARPPRGPSCSSRCARPAAAPRASTPSPSSTAGGCSSPPTSTGPEGARPSPAPAAERPRSARCCS